MQIDARKAGVKMAAERRRDNAKSDLDTLKAIQESRDKDR
jgi:hypothetical protein